LLVQLVLDLGAFGDLDQGRELLRGFVTDRYVVPGMGQLWWLLPEDVIAEYAECPRSYIRL
jgi:hypothetical protein